jgi:hypothetical protein
MGELGPLDGTNGSSAAMIFLFELSGIKNTFFDFSYFGQICDSTIRGLVVAPAGPLGQSRGSKVVAAIESSDLVKFHGGLLGVSSRRCTLDIGM